MKRRIAALLAGPILAFAGSYEDGLRLLGNKSYREAAAAFQAAAATMAKQPAEIAEEGLRRAEQWRAARKVK